MDILRQVYKALLDKKQINILFEEIKSMTYIKLYHCIWLLTLSPNAFRVYYSALSFMNTDTNYANVSMRKLAATVGV